MPDLVTEATLGHALRGDDAREFEIFDVEYAPSARFADHAHDRTYVSFVLRGTFTEEAGRSCDVAQSATVVLMPAGVAHRNHIGPAGARSLVIALDEGFERRISGGARLSNRRRWITRGAPQRLLLRAYRAYRMSSSQELPAISELLLAFADAVHDAADPADSAVVGAVIEILRDDVTRPLRLDRIATLVARDRAYLCRAFRRGTGSTIGEYLRQLRTKKAAHLIASGDTPLADIALACGFADQSHLTRVFTTHVGMTPHAYRTFARG